MTSARRSRGTRTKPFGVSGRVAVVLLASGIGALTPGVIAPQAWAQDGTSTTPSAPGSFYATPPPLDPATPLVGDGGGVPQTNYVQKIDCVQHSLGPNVDIKQRPWGQEYLQIGAAQKLVRAATPDHTAGGGIKVAVIDTGVTNHPYLAGRLVSGGDYVSIPKDVAPGLKDCDGHGTEVAGIIAAKPPADQGIGFTGVAPDATIVSIRQSSENYAEDTSSSTSSSTSQTPGGGGASAGGGTQPGQDTSTRQLAQQGTAGNLTSLAMAIRRAADIGDIKVINMSVDNCRTATDGLNSGEAQLHTAIDYAFKKDIVLVAAAGNTGQNCLQNDQLDPNMPKTIITPPLFSDEVLSVASIDPTGSVSSFSVNGPWVSVAAPGTAIISLDPAVGQNGLANQTVDGNSKPSDIQGTSFAAPYVSGLVALVRAKYPNLKAPQVMQRIMDTAQHPAAPGGRDTFIGHGVINPVQALTASLPSEEQIPVASNIRLPSDLPPSDSRNWTPMIVALAGTGGGLIALLVTLFVVHTVRRSRSEDGPRKAA
jgi:membrane-anchored mycosin MYCP